MEPEQRFDGAVDQDQDLRTRQVVDDIAVLVANLVPAVLFLVGYGVVIAEGRISTGLASLLGLAVVLDLASEIWVGRSAMAHDSPVLTRLVAIHGVATVVGYLILGGAVAGLLPAFTAYTAFLALWLTGFLIGEAIVLFLDDRFEALRDIGTGIEEDLF